MLNTQIHNPIHIKTVKPTSNQNLGNHFIAHEAGKNSSHVVFILDSSGSMQSCRDNTINGFNEFLEGQRLNSIETGINTVVSLYKFDGSSVSRIFHKVDANKAEKLSKSNYNPLGGTNLLDAIGGVLIEINDDLGKNNVENRESIIVVILTDGEENSSNVFNNESIRKMVNESEKKNWGFMFLGANINAFNESSKLGFSDYNTLQFANKSTANSMRSAGEMVNRMKGLYASGVETSLAYSSTTWSDTERSTAMKDDQS